MDGSNLGLLVLHGVVVLFIVYTATVSRVTSESITRCYNEHFEDYTLMCLPDTRIHISRVRASVSKTGGPGGCSKYSYDCTEDLHTDMEYYKRAISKCDNKLFCDDLSASTQMQCDGYSINASYVTIEYKCRKNDREQNASLLSACNGPFNNTAMCPHGQMIRLDDVYVGIFKQSDLCEPHIGDCAKSLKRIETQNEFNEYKKRCDDKPRCDSVRSSLHHIECDGSVFQTTYTTLVYTCVQGVHQVKTGRPAFLTSTIKVSSGSPSNTFKGPTIPGKTSKNDTSQDIPVAAYVVPVVILGIAIVIMSVVIGIFKRRLKEKSKTPRAGHLIPDNAATYEHEVTPSAGMDTSVMSDNVATLQTNVHSDIDKENTKDACENPQDIYAVVNKVSDRDDTILVENAMYASHL